MTIGSFFEQKQQAFTVEPQTIEAINTTFYPSDLIKFRITISLDPSLYVYSRITYSILDFLRDIGGLFSAIYGIFSLIVFALNFNAS